MPSRVTFGKRSWCHTNEIVEYQPVCFGHCSGEWGVAPYLGKQLGRGQRATFNDNKKHKACMGKGMQDHVHVDQLDDFCRREQLLGQDLPMMEYTAAEDGAQPKQPVPPASPIEDPLRPIDTRELEVVTFPCTSHSNHLRYVLESSISWCV